MAKIFDGFARQAPAPRKGMPSPRLDEREFKRRYRQQFFDPAFRAHDVAIETLADVAWEAYEDSRKSPVTRKAGAGFADPDYDLSVEWIAAHDAVRDAQERYEDGAGSPRILLVNGSSRSEHTCPGEMSKSYRLIEQPVRQSNLRLVYGPASSISLASLPNTGGRYIRASRAFPRRPRSATGPARAIRTIPWARSTIG
jgi:hypothetical protein